MRALATRLVQAGARATPPFQTEAYEYAELRGVAVIEGSLPKGETGALIRIGEQALVAVARRTPRVHRNFTVCHELGHLAIQDLLTEASDSVTAHQNYSDAEERLCDVFASELLMPTQATRDFAREWPETISSIQALAERFHVSVEAMARRIAELRLWDSTIVILGTLRTAHHVQLRPKHVLAPNSDAASQIRAWSLSAFSALAPTTTGLGPGERSLVVRDVYGRQSRWQYGMHMLDAHRAVMVVKNTEITDATQMHV